MVSNLHVKKFKSQSILNSSVWAKMQTPEQRIEELTARIITLEAAIKSGSSAPAAEANESAYPFVDKLSGDDLIAAKALIQENASLHKQIEELKDLLAQKDFRIKHLKQGLEQYIK